MFEPDKIVVDPEKIIVHRLHNKGSNRRLIIPTNTYYQVKLISRTFEDDEDPRIEYAIRSLPDTWQPCSKEQNFFAYRLKKHYLLIGLESGYTDDLDEHILDIAHSYKESESKLYSLCIDAAKEFQKEYGVPIEYRSRK